MIDGFPVTELAEAVDAVIAAHTGRPDTAEREVFHGWMRTGETPAVLLCLDCAPVWSDMQEAFGKAVLVRER